MSREDFERMLNVEIHEGDENTRLVSDESKEAPVERAIRAKDENKQKKSIPAELARNTIEYIDENGDRVVEEVGA